MKAQEYREKKLKEIDEHTSIIRPAITVAFPVLFDLARALQDADFRNPVKVETPFGYFIFSPADEIIEDLKN